MNKDGLTEKKISGENLFDGVILHLRRDQVELPDGGVAEREYIVHNGAVCVIPIDENGLVAMVRQHRYAAGRVTLEVPAGKLDFVGEDPLEAAKRELKEETGYTAETFLDLGVYRGAPAYSSEVVYTFAAKDLKAGDMAPDEDEFLLCEKYPLESLVDMVLSGEITDGHSQCAILKLAQLRSRGKF